MEGETTTNAVEVRFTGNTREYFGIWIVNFLLSIITLGVWSAWAKVRNRKYFLGNTSIENRPFGYHATGLQILIGRLIVVAFFAAYWILSALSPVAGFSLIALFVFVMPWLINRGLRFNAAMTSWSSVRFRFEGSYWPAFAVLMLYPALVALSLHLALPFVTRALKRYTIGRHRLGGHSFTFDSEIGPFYGAFAAVGVWAFFGFIFSLGIALSSHTANRDVGAFLTTGDIDSSTVIYVIVLAAIYFVAFFPLSTIYAAFTRYAIYAGTTLEGGHRFRSTISPPRLVWIVISNTVAVVVSLGMLLPWARIRLARYLCAHTWVIPGGSLDDFVGEAERRQSALGDAYMDIDGIDVGAAA